MLNSKVSESQSIYVNEIRQVQQTAEKWKNFLEFSAQARISKTQSEYEFSSKLIIHAHNPNATDCRQFGEWKTSDGNHVNRHEKGIPVLSGDRNGNQSVMYLFDTSQTALPKEPERILIPEEHKESFKFALDSMIDKLSDNASFSDEQKKLFRETAEYKLCKQYGLTTNENPERFSGIEKMSVKDVANIGIALNRCSKEFSSIIERNDFNDYERIDDSKSGEDRTELHGRERRGMDLGGGVSGTRHEIPIRRESEAVVQAQRREFDLRTADRDTLSEANGSNGQIRQHETEIHMENSMPDRNDNAERGNGYNQALRGNERTSSEPDRRNNGEEKAVGGVQGDSEIGQIHSDGAVTGEVQSGSGGRNTSSDGLRNITNETAEPDMVSAVSDLSDNSNKDVQSKEQSDTFENAKHSKNGDIILGNTTFRYIPEKTYTQINKDIAANVVEQLEKQGIKFSGVIKGDTATITVSKPQKETLDKIIVDISSPDNDVNLSQNEFIEIASNILSADETVSNAHKYSDKQKYPYVSVKAGWNYDKYIAPELETRDYTVPEFNNALKKLSERWNGDEYETKSAFVTLTIHLSEAESFEKRLNAEYQFERLSQRLNYDTDWFDSEIKLRKAVEEAEKNEKSIPFSSLDFEKKIPDGMRWKEKSIVEDNRALHWVTQEIFTEADLDKFQAALRDTDIEKAYVIPRDLSGYSFEDDVRNNAPFAVVTKDSISCKDYIDKIKSVYDYDVSKQQEEKEPEHKKQALISIEIMGDEHYFKINESSVDDILKTANTEKPLLEFIEMGEKISEEEYAEIQQSDSFTYSVEMNLDNDTARIYTVNNGNGGISETDRTDNNVTFDTVKISDCSGQSITANPQEIQNEATRQHTSEEHHVTDNLPETRFTALSEEARTYYAFYPTNTLGNRPEESPWGKVDSCHELNKGIFRVSTPSHGGIMIRSSVADKILSPEARKIGFREKGFHCYEEDCDACVAERELLDKGIMQVPDYYTDGAERYNEIINDTLKTTYPDYWNKREQAIFNARPIEKQAAITGQMSLFGDIPDLEDFPDFTEEENISDNTVTKPVEKSDLSQNEKNAPVNDLSEVSAEKQEREPTVKKEYFRITDEHLGEGSKREKFQSNIEAIRTLQLIENEERPATPEEQETLSKYIGWGGLQEAFDENNSAWSKEYSELINLLSEEEYEAARSTVNDAFYTSPVITQAIYEGLSNIGFEGGEILEPSMGVGNFFGTMPDSIRENSNLAGIEIDSISGRIAQKLYPEANIAINGYEKIKLEKGSFDLAVGNVPFGNHGVNDKTKAYKGLLIHDYFFAKSLDSVRSGGVVAFVTSTGTLDKEDTNVRQMLAQKAELMGAVRLPNNAFQKNAGTQTSTDIIFLKKREKPLILGDMPMDKSCDWVHTKENADGLKINSYFADNPDMVLGKLSDNGRFGSIVCTPFEGADLKEQLHEAMKNIKGEYTPLEFQQELDERAENKYLTATPDIENLTYTVVEDKLYYRVDDNLIPLKESEQHGIIADRRKAMCGLGETVRELLQAQVEDRPDKEIKSLQAELTVKYDKFSNKYGRINPIETPNSRNASGVSRKAPNSNVFKNDVRLPLLQSLEKMKNGQFVGKTEIFTERTIRPHKVAEHVDTAHEALILSISEKGKIDFDYMEQLTGFEKNKIIDDLHGDIFPVPELSTEDNTVYQTSDEYLSGNIYKKIAQAEAKISENSEYEKNIAALTEVIPKPLKATEIDMQLGMTWIDTKIIQQFMYETFETPTRFKEYDSNVAQKNPNAITVSYSGSGKGSWKIENAKSDNSVKSTKNFGTKDYNAYELLEKILNAKSVAVTEVVKDHDTGNKKTVILEKETKAAEDKVKQINAAFKKWIFADPERRNELVKTYNEKFNCIRPREYDGSNLNFFGSNPEISLKPHQKNAVAHALFGGNTLFAHQVGAGKTFEMIATAMEGKRLGLHNKSMFVVPNHLTEQIGSDFMKLYPNANILVAKSDDFSPQKRRQMCARIATGNFDAVIIGHSQLIKIPISAKREEKFIRNQINEVVSALSAAEETDSKSYTVKQLEATRKNLRDRLEKLTNGTVKDNAVTFEELGVDKLFVDEAHEFKNLYVSTKMENVSGLSTNADVQKTQDLYMKCQYLDEKTGSKGIVFSTGTPVTNALSEMFTTMKYLQSDLLEETGLDSFDSWAGNFTRKSTEAEISPSGSDWRMKTRLKFTNVPELVTMFKECADIKMADQLNLDVPECEKHIVSVEPTEAQKAVVESLAERAERISRGEVSRTEDNMLVVTGDGRKLGLDQRLYDLNLPDEPQTKLNACIQNVYEIWEKNSDKKSTQLVFCDLGVPQSKEDLRKNGERFDVYNDIRSKLIEKGIPEKEIAFIHDAASETEKAKLFAKVRSGDVRVLIGSTQKMGAGTNVQNKLIALHDLDCPWRPADLTQRLGRMVRQGNENDKVDNFRYVTKGTFDAYLYQMVEKKQESIAQIFTSKAIARTCDDIDDMAVDFMQVKMAAVGDDRIRRQMELREDIRSLNMLKNTYLENKYEIEDNIKLLPEKIAKTEKIIEGIAADTKAIKAYVPKKDIDGKEVFEMKVGNTLYTDKKEAAEAFMTAMTKAVIGNPKNPTDIVEYKGFKIAVSYDSFAKSYTGHIKGANRYPFDLGSSESGNLTRIDNAIASVPMRIERYCNELDRIKTELADSQKEVNQPFEHEAELEEKKQELERLTDEINADKVKGEIPPEQPESTVPNNQEQSEKSKNLNIKSKDKIIDPYFLKVKSDMLPVLGKSGLNFEHCERNGEIIIKFNRCDREKTENLINAHSKQLKPKL